MDYEKKYKDALERAKSMIDDLRKGEDILAVSNLETMFPELKESEDERIRKALIRFHKSSIDIDGIKGEDILAWLEKQGKKPKKVSVWKHWKDGIAGGSEGEQIFLTRIGRIYSISSCLGCECDYIELSELDKLQRMEEQQ